jgi:glutamate carboxypeptidase
VHTTRKGVGMYRLRANGISAHAGARPEEGRSAVLDLAHKTIALHALTDFEVGTTVNVGVVEGGTRRNVVPAEAEILVDLRAVTAAEAERADEAIHAIASAQHVEGVTVELSGGMNRPPLEKAPGTEQSLFVARRIVTELGLTFDEATSGGGSDGNFTAPLGVPTLDGLGAVGGGAHALHEWIELDSLPDRLTLVAGLIAWGPARER